MRWTLTLLLIALPVLAVFVRFAPSSPDRWHRPGALTGLGDYEAPGGFRVERALSEPAPVVLAAIERLALAAPRTQTLAGSVDAGMITFVTRSRVMGFPDYTTVAVQGDVLVIHGRLRFGKSDFGVNRARVLGWLTQLGPLTEPL